MKKKLGIATRFYGFAREDTRRLKVWLDAALRVVSPSSVYIAIHSEADKSQSQRFLQEHYPEVRAFTVTPWGRVVQAPNAILLKSAEHVSHLLFTSTEYPVTSPFVERLHSHMDDDTLVVGARLKGHDFKAVPGTVERIAHASGLQIPWNTYALWSLSHLIHTGFVLTADSFEDPDNAGMEEMGTIAAQQILWPSKAKAILVAPSEQDLVFNTYGWTIERHERYTRNLESKKSRSEAQLERLSLPNPEVSHIG